MRNAIAALLVAVLVLLAGSAAPAGAVLPLPPPAPGKCDIETAAHLYRIQPGTRRGATIDTELWCGLPVSILGASRVVRGHTLIAHGSTCAVAAFTKCRMTASFTRPEGKPRLYTYIATLVLTGPPHLKWQPGSIRGTGFIRHQCKGYDTNVVVCNYVSTLLL